jgi:hypothetical protein
LGKGNEVTIFEIYIWGISPVQPIADNINLEIIKGDIRIKEHLANEMTEQDAIVHVAVIFGYPSMVKKAQLIRLSKEQLISPN